MSESAENEQPKDRGGKEMTAAESLGKYLSYVFTHEELLVTFKGDDLQLDKKVARRIERHPCATIEAKRMAFRTASQLAAEGYLVEIYFVGFDTPGLKPTDCLWFFRIVNGPSVRTVFMLDSRARELGQEGYIAHVRKSMRGINKNGVHFGPEDSKN